MPNERSASQRRCWSTRGVLITKKYVVPSWVARKLKSSSAAPECYRSRIPPDEKRTECRKTCSAGRLPGTGYRHVLAGCGYSLWGAMTGPRSLASPPRNSQVIVSWAAFYMNRHGQSRQGRNDEVG